jgi:hypothetical protein
MILYWNKHKEKGWILRSFINGLGALATLLTTAIIGYEKFTEGAWIVLILLPIILYGMLSIKRHYNLVAEQLRASKEDINKVELGRQFNHICVIPIASVNKATLEALQYAKSISSDVIALNVSADKEAIVKLQSKWNELDSDIMLVCKYSPYRQVLAPLLGYIKLIANATSENEKVTVIVPEFITHKWWGNLLHNHTGLILRENLLRDKNIVVSTYSYQLED